MMTPFVRQFHAELLKARGRSLYYGALVVLLFFSVLPLAIAFSAWRDVHLRPWALQFVTFPAGIWSTLRLVQYILPTLVVVVAAGAMGGEYATGTWKMTLPRTAHRASALLARAVASLVLSMGALWLSVVLSLISSAAGAALLGVPFAPGVSEGMWGDLLRAQAFFLIEFGFVISLAALAVVLTRSLMGGALLGALAYHLLPLGVFLPVGWLLPSANLQALEQRWLRASSMASVDMAEVLGRAMSWQGSLSSVLLFSACFLLVATWQFSRRDLAS